MKTGMIEWEESPSRGKYTASWGDCHAEINHGMHGIWTLTIKKKGSRDSRIHGIKDLRRAMDIAAHIMADSNSVEINRIIGMHHIEQADTCP